ncbi:MAG TPA: DUF6458 family protein [Streptosporangiaceae bacterium]|nr:DUF6458 family protein [Streptosporangiaceae bacterium]
MNRATSLTVIAIGAIFAFAVTASPGFLNLQVVGWILMATGAAGLLLERRNRDWLRRTVIVRSSADSARFNRRRQSQLATSRPAEPSAKRPAERPSADDPTRPIGEPAERETIEEYIEQ